MNLQQRLNSLISYKRSNINQYDKKVSAYIAAEIKLLEQIQAYILELQQEKESAEQQLSHEQKKAYMLELICYIVGLEPYEIQLYFRKGIDGLEDMFCRLASENAIRVPQKLIE